MSNSASDRIGPRTRLFRPLRTRSSRPLPVEREAEGLLCSCCSPSPYSDSRSWLYLHYKQNYRTGCTKFCNFHCMWVALLLMAHTKWKGQRRRRRSDVTLTLCKSLQKSRVLHIRHYLSLRGNANLSYLVVYLWFTSYCCLYLGIYSIKWQDDWHLKKLKRFRTQTWSNWGTIPAFVWRNMGKPWKTPKEGR